MKVQFCSLSLLAAFSLVATAADPLPVAPSGILVRFEQAKKKSDSIIMFKSSNPLVEIGLVLTAPNKKTQLSVPKDAPVDIVGTDSSGKNLGKISVEENFNMGFPQKPDYVVCLGMEKSPAPGAEWIQAKGNLNVRVLDKKVKTEPVAVTLEKGSKVKVGAADLEIEQVTPSGDSLKVKIQLVQQEDSATVMPESLLFQKEDGTPIKAVSNMYSSSSFNDKCTMNFTYTLKANDHTVKVVLVSKTGDIVKIPVDVKVNIGGPVK